jgi:hypothetical protein
MTANLLVALDAHQITAAEFAEAVHFLAPEAAHLAIAMLSDFWAQNPAEDHGRRLQARLLCQTSSVAPLPLN